jgi:uncharacterized RmlC-like cupin family protein
VNVFSEEASLADMNYGSYLTYLTQAKSGRMLYLPPLPIKSELADILYLCRLVQGRYRDFMKW